MGDLQKTAFDGSVAHCGVGKDCGDHVENGAVEDAVPSVRRTERVTRRRKTGIETKEQYIEPVARKELHTFDGNIVVRASLLRCGVGQTQHVTQCLYNAEASHAHNRLRCTLLEVSEWRRRWIGEPALYEW